MARSSGDTFASAAMSAAASWRTVVMPKRGQLGQCLRADAPDRVRRAVAEHVEPGRRGQPGRRRRLPKLVAILACSLLSPMPTEQSRPVAALTSATRPRAKPSGSSVVDADERLIPAEDLDRAAGFPQHVHHHRRRSSL